MKTTFELKAWMSENRNLVISNYTNLTNETHFNGISLKEFMVQILDSMVLNGVKSEKRAASLLPSLVEMAFVNNSTMGVRNNLDEKFAAKYENSAYMALV